MKKADIASAFFLPIYRPFTFLMIFFKTSFLLLILSLGLVHSLPAFADGKKLVSHPSPYIRSHADDPINWKIVSKEAISNAKKGNRPILISSGYQSCYWCYRMKVDTFSNKKLADKINESFLPLLIDREIEPQLDKQLQDFMLEQRGFGGWPVTVILTPDGNPVAGFSYTSPESLQKAIEQFQSQWKKNPNRVSQLAQTSALARNKKIQQQDQLLEEVDFQVILKIFLNQISAASDDKYGGFGENEKFPNYPQLNAMLDLYSLNPDKALAEFIQLTLDNMLNGALRDQLSGGFFRYVESREWQNPHYEQMLYTQALMGKLLIRAGQTFKQPNYLIAGRDTLLNMVNKFGDGSDSRLFNASLSALDNNNKAGGYYLWKSEELEEIINNNGKQTIQNLLSSDKLVLPKPIGDKAEEIRTALLTQRQKRQQQVDRKKILAWQGLALSGLAYGSQLSPEINQAAKSLATSILELVEKNKLNTLAKSSGQTNYNLSDLTYLAQGLLDWWQVSGEDKALNAARKLLIAAYEEFYKEGRWLQGNSYGFLETPPALAISDTQLPSPSAIWLSLSWALSALDNSDKKSSLTTMADNASSRLPHSLKSNAFFHASLISTLIAREWRLRNNLNRTQNAE